MQLDVKDIKLLSEIDLNARLGTSRLGKRIHLSQEGTYYRLQRLEKKQVVKGYITLLNFGKLGYTGYGVYARFHNVTKEQKQHIHKELTQHNHIYWIAEFGGKFDIAFAIMARNIVHFNEIYTEIATKYNDVLKDFTVAIRVELTQFPRSYLTKSTVSDKAPRFGRYIESQNLDAIDKEILSVLATNARVSTLQLAKTIKRPASTVRARLKQLEQREIIQGYSALINCQEFDYESFQLFLNTQNLTVENKRKLFTYCQQHPNIIFYIETVGKWDFEIIYEVRDQKEFQELLTDIRTVLNDIIQNVESIVLFNHHVKYNQYPLKN